MKPTNETLEIPIVLKEGSQHNVVTTVKQSDGSIFDLSNYTFVANLLDKQGGSILDTVTLSLVTDGSDGQYQELFEIAELDALITAETLPRFWEVFASPDGVSTNYVEWYRGQVIVQRKGT